MGAITLLALFLLSPIHEFHSLPQELSTTIFVQGNYILANNVSIEAQSVSYLDILGKNPGCPLSGQCVAYVKTKLPTLPSGNANQIKPNTYTPCIGCAIIFNGGKYGHIAYIENISGDDLLISETNVEGCGVISWRWISKDLPNILGHWKP